MKIQSLAIIFILIVLPITITLTEYSQAQIDTSKLEAKYDAALITATYDALKALQINMANNAYSDIADTKLNSGIEASANTFYNSLEASLAMRGFDKEDIQLHTPALVYTMYDGYYIYSPYTNVAVLDTTNQEVDININSGNIDYGFKPYVYYSCRYVPQNDNDSDFVITYSLDNYISIVGMINGTYVNESGYLIDKSTLKKSGNTYIYNGIEITPEGTLTETLLDPSDPLKTKEYKYIKINGTKYYWDEENEEIFFISNGSRQRQGNRDTYEAYVDAITNNSAGYLYYEEAYIFTNWVLGNSVLKDLRASDAVDSNGNRMNLSEGNYTFIFKNASGEPNVPLEYPSSNFNEQRKAVIRYSIESNLSVSIANFNAYSSSTNEFQMPKLKETDWDMLENQVSIISFLQGFSIGGKIYNGYTVITNDKTEEVVKEEDIFIISEDGYYHRINDEHFINNLQTGVGILDTDFEVRRDLETQLYYLPKNQLGCYTSIVSQDNVNHEFDSIYEYLENEDDVPDDVKRAYYTALGRERWGLYRVTDKEELSSKLENLKNSNN